MSILLSDPLLTHIRVLPPQEKALKKLGIQTVGDLLFHFPVRYGDTAEVRGIATVQKGDSAVVFGRLTGLKMKKGFRTKMAMAEGRIEDESGSIKAMWFNQPYIAKMYPEGALVRAEGKVSMRKDEAYLSNPKLEKITVLPTGVGDSLFGEGGTAHTLYPVYPESRGVTSNWMYHSVSKLIQKGALDSITEIIPDDILTRYHLPTRRTALIWIHAPQNKDDALSARKRFAFEEVFFIQLGRLKDKRELMKEEAFVIETTEEHIETFAKRFPFEPTNAQNKAIKAILDDFKTGEPMSRLLEGDVGSGKTFVAAAACYAAVTTRPRRQNFGTLQAAYMAPTEILAGQHFQSFMEYFSHLPIGLALITGSGCKKFPSKVNPRVATDISRTQLLKWVKNGEISIVIGTHALIQKSVQFKHLALAIIDEQHRFGVNQRRSLIHKDEPVPHLLSMTATPIPRTLSLTMYGDLDLTVLDELPAGRKPIITEVVIPDKREETYERVRKELKSGRQMYVICPRIDEPDPTKEMAMLAKSVKAEAARLKKDVFPEYEIGVLHGKMKPDEKDRVMADFKAGKIHILLATSVVEVGVNVPNATVILIEGAERFGLAQLHQLRGRVQRSSYQAYCFTFADTKNTTSVARLKALATAKNGFELAELDLKFRGAGNLYSGKQWGLSDIGMEALQNIKMIEAARSEAVRLLSENPSLSNYPLLQSAVTESKEELHFE